MAAGRSTCTSRRVQRPTGGLDRTVTRFDALHRGTAEQGLLWDLRATVTGLSRVQRNPLHIGVCTTSRPRHTTDTVIIERTSGTRRPHAPRRRPHPRPPRTTRQRRHPRTALARPPHGHRPCGLSSEVVDARGRIGTRSRDADSLTLDEQLTSLPGAADHRTPGPLSTSSPPSPSPCATPTPRAPLRGGAGGDAGPVTRRPDRSRASARLRLLSGLERTAMATRARSRGHRCRSHSSAHAYTCGTWSRKYRRVTVAPMNQCEKPS